MEEGIVYADLSDEEKQEYEDTFADEEGDIPDLIPSSALNERVFNIDTIREVLNIVMNQSLKIDYGEKIGKTIIFATSHRHAEKICEIFNAEYPHLVGYAQVIDNHINYAQSLIDDFSDAKRLPQIAISVDMLDTGIDVPEVLNLVFFKKVFSKAKFWQMIGRGTRLCPQLIDGKDKEFFYIFDFCGNFECFRENNNGRESESAVMLQGAVFYLKFQMAFKLQDLVYQTDELIAYRKSLVSDMTEKVKVLNRENFSVRQHLKYVELYSDEKSYDILTYADTITVHDELVPLIEPDDDDPQAVRFDALLYGMELCLLSSKSYGKRRSDLFKKVTAVSKLGTIPEIAAQSQLIDRILHTDYVDTAGVAELEHIRKSLRDLIKYIPHTFIPYDTDFDDNIISEGTFDAELESDDLKDYRAKAEYYVRRNMNNPVIEKLHNNIPLTTDDIAELERIMWSEIGTHEDYEGTFGKKPLGVFIREIVGLDMRAAKEAFSAFLSDTNLDSRQIYFINQIVEYIVKNGILMDLSVLQDSPFTDMGSISEIFTDVSVWQGIKQIIGAVNANAAA